MLIVQVVVSNGVLLGLGNNGILYECRNVQITNEITKNIWVESVYSTDTMTEDEVKELEKK